MHELRFILLLIIIFIVIYLLGISFSKKIGKSLLFGFIIALAIFQIIIIPMIFLHTTFTFLKITYFSIIILLCILSLFYNRVKIVKPFHSIKFNIKDLPKRTLLIILITVLIVFIQTFIVYKYTHIDEDDAFYVATAVAANETDSMFKYDVYTGEEYSKFPARYVLSPFPILLATLASIVGLHVTILSHTFLPLLLIPLAYFIYVLIASELFRCDYKKVSIFIIVISFLNIFGSYSVYTTSSFLLFRIWQGKAVLANIIVPIVIYLFILLMKYKKKHVNWLMLFLTAFCGSLVSSMGIVLFPVLVGCMGISYSIYSKSIKTLLMSGICCIPCIVYGIIEIILLY